MMDQFAELVSALRERITVITDQRSRENPDVHIGRLQNISERIDEIQLRLPGNIEPQLRHFLDRRSYEKALALLEERTAPN